SRLLKFEEEGEFLKVVGSFGSNPGQLENPTDIAIGPGGNVWVAGWQDNRVSEFDKTGKFVQRFGEQGSGNGQFEHPDAIDVDEKGNVWVLDEGNSRVEHFNEKGKYLGKFGTEGSGEGQFGFHYPTGIATDSEEGIWVADGLNNRVQGWARGVPKATTESATAVEATLATLNATVNPEGRATSYWFEYGKTTSYGTKIPASPASVGSGTSNVAVSQTPKGLSESTEYHFRVVAESVAGTSKGADKTFTTWPNFSFAFGKGGSGKGQLDHPAGIAIDSKGDLWVVDMENARVEEFNREGDFIFEFGKKGSGKGQFTYPAGIAIDSKGNVWVADAFNNRVEKFDEEGEFLFELKEASIKEGQF